MARLMLGIHVFLAEFKTWMAWSADKLT